MKPSTHTTRSAHLTPQSGTVTAPGVYPQQCEVSPDEITDEDFKDLGADRATKKEASCVMRGVPPWRHYSTPHTAAAPRATVETSRGETRRTRPRHLATCEPASDMVRAETSNPGVASLTRITPPQHSPFPRSCVEARPPLPPSGPRPPRRRRLLPVKRRLLS